MENRFNSTAAYTAPSEAFGEVIIAKVVTMCAIGAASFIVGMAPLFLKRLIKVQTSPDQGKHLVLSLLLCFGGGVLLFTTFLHLQPEVRESFSQLESQNKIPAIGHGISTSELVFCMGFFFVYLIEELVHKFLDHKIEDDEVLHRSLSVRCKHLDPPAEKATIPRETTHKHEIERNAPQVPERALDIKTSFSVLMTVLALSFHGIFEGLAVGLEKEARKVWYLLIAISTHKLVIAFCVGVELVTSKTRLLLMILYMATFALVTPLGIGIGIILTNTGKSDVNVTTLVLQGMAAGTILYVVFFEVLAREKSNRHSGVWQLLAILTGFVLMCVLQITTGHSHSHDEGTSNATVEATTAL